MGTHIINGHNDTSSVNVKGTIATTIVDLFFDAKENVWIYPNGRRDNKPIAQHPSRIFLRMLGEVYLDM